MKIKTLPNILALHLKRFKFQPNQQYIKLSHRVVFPLSLRLFNTCSSTPDAQRLYTLQSIIIHIGAGPFHGHYISLVKSASEGLWIAFDDEGVNVVKEGELVKFFGDFGSPGTGYIFMYQSEEFVADVSGMSLPKESEGGVDDDKARDVVDGGKKKKKSKDLLGSEVKEGAGDGAKDAWWSFRRQSNNTPAGSPVTENKG